jgi:hypothetical protein
MEGVARTRLGPRVWRPLLHSALAALWVALAVISPDARWFAAAAAICWLLVAGTMVLDRYSFDADGLRSHRRFGLRPQRIAWSEVRRFENRGFWLGAGAWLTNGRWFTLRGVAFRDKGRADREVALLECVRQQPRGQLAHR